MSLREANEALVEAVEFFQAVEVEDLTEAKLKYGPHGSVKVGKDLYKLPGSPLEGKWRKKDYALMFIPTRGKPMRFPMQKKDTLFDKMRSQFNRAKKKLGQAAKAIGGAAKRMRSKKYVGRLQRANI